MPLKGRSFQSLAEQNAFLDHWEKSVADTRIHGTTRQQVRAHFLTVEKPRLLPLPAGPMSRSANSTLSLVMMTSVLPAWEKTVIQAGELVASGVAVVTTRISKDLRASIVGSPLPSSAGDAAAPRS